MTEYGGHCTIALDPPDLTFLWPQSPTQLWAKRPDWLPTTFLWSQQTYFPIAMVTLALPLEFSRNVLASFNTLMLLAHTETQLASHPPSQLLYLYTRQNGMGKRNS